MPDTFAVTIISIIVFTVIAAFIKGRSKDKCLNDFAKDMVNLEKKSGKIIYGRLHVENTGMELVYKAAHRDKQGHAESSYILYKNEYSDIQALIRYHDELDEAGKEKRRKELQRTYHPSATRRLKRQVLNLFKTVRDSVMDVINLFIGRIQRTSGIGAALSPQDKYVSQVKQELVGSLGTAFEPLLERHIGKRVVLEIKKGDAFFEYPGVLKDYTAEFVEIMDVDYEAQSGQASRKADLVAPRQAGVVRHLGE